MGSHDRLWALRCRCDFINGKIRSVGAQECRGLAHLVQLCKNGLLQLEVLKDSLDDANLWLHQYMNRWHDGIDADDFDDLTNLMSALLRGRTKDAFTTATENFRPKPTADSTP